MQASSSYNVHEMFALRGPLQVNCADPVALEIDVLPDAEVPIEDPEKPTENPEKELAAAVAAVDVEITVNGPEDPEDQLSDEAAAVDVETVADAPEWLESTPPTEPPHATLVQIAYDPKIKHTRAA